jgi:competence protein ComEA
MIRPGAGMEEVERFMQTLTQPRMLAAAGLLLLAAGLLWGAFRDEKPERLPPDWRPVNDRLAASVGENDGSDAGRAGSTDAAASPASGRTGGVAASGGGPAAESDAAGERAGPEAASGADGPPHGTADDSGGASVADAPGSAAMPGAAPGTTSGAPSGTASGDAPGSAPGFATEGASGTGGFDINRATEAEWDELPGIGPAKARAIVEDRERNGPFRSVDDLARVKGIGPKLLERIKEAIEARNASGG